MTLPFCQASDNNKAPIIEVLRQAFADRSAVLEIGAGTGQHGVHFAPRLPHLVWQSTDRADKLAGITRWHRLQPSTNLLPPKELDVTATWLDWPFDAAFSANTAHIMGWPAVEAMFRGVAVGLPPGGVFCLYGPFHQDGRPTSDGNARFDAALRGEDPAMGIRDDRAIWALAQSLGLEVAAEHSMPANNRLFQFIRL